MITDTLSDCVTHLDYYLNSAIFESTYQGAIRERIIRLRNEAEYIRLMLDVPPECRLLPEAVLMERIDAQRSRTVEDRCYLLASEI